jgi:phospholipid N-methyltransferase
LTHAYLLQQLEDDMRASVASGNSDVEAIEKSRDAFEDWLHSDFDEAKVYSAEELDLRRALKMEA